MSYQLPEPVTYLGNRITRIAWNGEPVDGETLTWVHQRSQIPAGFAPGVAFVPFGKSRAKWAVPCTDPRGRFGEAMVDILGDRKPQWSVANSAGNMIGEGVELPDSLDIGFGNVIYPGVVIGERVTIGNNNVIGGPGYNLYRTRYPAEAPKRFPHVGGVTIGNDAVIQNNTNIDAGLLSPTFIGDQCAIDSQIHIAHDVTLGVGSKVIAGAVVCGWAKIGAGATVAPNASVRNRITVGDGALVGLAANAVKDVPAGCVVKGNPAQKHVK